MKNNACLLCVLLACWGLLLALPAQTLPPPPAPDSVRATVEQAAALKDDAPHKALDLLATVITVIPPDIQTDLDKAEHIAKLAVLFQSDRTYYDAALLAGSLQLQIHSAGMALRYYEAIWDAKQKSGIQDGEIYNRLGWAAYKSGDLDKAVKNFELAIATEEPLDPGTKDKPGTKEKARNNLGQVYFQMGNLPEAKKVWKQSSILGSEFAKEALAKIEEFEKAKAQESQK